MDWKKESDVVQEIDFKNSDQSKGNFLYPYWIKDLLTQETFYIPFRLKSQNVMRLPPKKFYQLYNLGSSKSTDMTIPKKQSITLVPVKTMDITLDFSVKRPAFISLKTKYPKGQFTFENASLPKNTSKVSSNVILVKKWPLKLTLIENEYDLELFDDNETFAKKSSMQNQAELLNAKQAKHNKVIWNIATGLIMINLQMFN